VPYQPLVDGLRPRLERENALDDRAIEQCQLRHRIKYEVLGLITRTQALVAVGRRADALADLQGAVALARHMGDPALFVRAASLRLATDESEELALEVSATVKRIVTGLPDDLLRRSFESSEPVRAVLTMAP